MGTSATVQVSSDSNPTQITSYNPATGVALGDVPIMTADEVRDAVARARAAQASWQELDLRERCRRVRRFSAVLLDRADEVIELLVKESGKTKTEALSAEVTVIVDLVNYFAKQAPRILADEPIPMHLLKHRKSYLHYVPHGVVGVISPWNFPFSIPMGEVLMAVIAGNGVVLKPSEVTPLIALKAKELFDESGIPSDLFQVVTGLGATGAALIDSGIDYCVFTGSVATGRKVAAACGERLIGCTLELGGKAPAIVCADADLERTAHALVWGGFANSGQVCASVERVYVHQSVYDELVDLVVKIASGLRQGDASSEDVDVGAMAWNRQVDIVQKLVDEAVTEGAIARVGGHRVESNGQFFAPTVLTGVTQDMRIMHAETFGPVIPIMAVESEEQAIEFANDSHLGLLAYVFTKDKRKGQRIAERIEAGTVMVNDVLMTYGCPETPWGGVKQSGLGRTHSAIGLRDLCEIRHVNYDRASLKKELWWYPYSESRFQYLLKAIRVLFRKRLPTFGK